MTKLYTWRVTNHDTRQRKYACLTLDRKLEFHRNLRDTIVYPLDSEDGKLLNKLLTETLGLGPDTVEVLQVKQVKL